tara:strand:- start:3312 stop:4385 length:1074 start_codon:yes stop_codon:yes gene_type:complete
MNNPHSPFQSKYTPQLPELLNQLGCSIAISTYQAGKLVFISSQDGKSLTQLPRNFEKAMGIAEDYEKDKLAIACRDEVIVFKNSKDLAAYYPKSPNKYDSLYVPRITYYTGTVDVHDVHFGEDDQIYAVNTLFSCIVRVDGEYNFTPVWQPHFIDKIAPEDRCHLNGMAMQNDKPKYVTAFNRGNTPKSWREGIENSGIVIDVETNKVIADGLAMPHSPTLINGELYLLQSANGQLIKINTETGEKEVILETGAFARGMSYYNDFLFIGMSKLRENSTTFKKIIPNIKNNVSGVLVVHLPTKSKYGSIVYDTSLDEIYDVHVLKDKVRPNILNTIKPLHKESLMLPETTFWKKKKSN